MTTRKPKPAPGKFAKGNKAASKGEPRTVSFTCRLPERTAIKLADLAIELRNRSLSETHATLRSIYRAEMRQAAMQHKNHGD